MPPKLRPVRFCLTPPFQGYDLQAAARAIDEAGFLEREAGARGFQKKKSVQGKKRNFYWVRALILEADSDAI